MHLKQGLLFCAAIAASTYSYADSTFYDYGRVVHLKPIYHHVHHNHRPHRDCRDTYTHSHSSGSHSYWRKSDKTRTENELAITKNGHKRYDLQQQSKHLALKPSHHAERRPSRCDSRGHRHRELKGFDVTYRYKGEVLHTFMRHDPGRRIRLQISISPAE